MLFIYWLEGHPQHHPQVRNIYRMMEARGDQLFASTLAYGEVMAGHKSVTDAKRFFSSSVNMVPFDVVAAEHFGDIRGRLRLKAPDAINLACAAAAGVDLFITHDKQLAGKFVSGVQFIVPLYNQLF
jgi:predicted nucleic acid-binding protein